MIDESALSYKRGDLVEFQLSLGGGPKKCRGLILNTAVLYVRAARQLWILDMDDATPGSRWRGRSGSTLCTKKTSSRTFLPR